MNKIFIDTNVLLDFLLNRDGADEAEAIFRLSEQDAFLLLLSSLSMSNIAYITRKIYKGEQLYEELEMVRSFVRLTVIDEVCVDEAISLRAIDFEDSLQYISAKKANADVIVTNNIKHFHFDDIKVMTPAEFLQAIK